MSYLRAAQREHIAEACKRTPGDWVIIEDHGIDRSNTLAVVAHRITAGTFPQFSSRGFYEARRDNLTLYVRYLGRKAYSHDL